jgi:hypothetical protein
MVANFKYDLWNTDPIPESPMENVNIIVHCLMPNGNYISFDCSVLNTLRDFKLVIIIKNIIMCARWKNPVIDES